MSVGMTTPEVEENQDMTPAVTPRIVVAVFALITEASDADSKSIPPRAIITFMRTPTPQIRSSVPQGIFFKACSSSETRRKERIIATVKLASPTFTLKSMTSPTMLAIPISVIICSLLKAGMSENFKTTSDFNL